MKHVTNFSFVLVLLGAFGLLVLFYNGEKIAAVTPSPEVEDVKQAVAATSILEEETENGAIATKSITKIRGTENDPIGSKDVPDTFLVTRVVDGDTIEIEGGERVRYIGVNTPESVDPRRKVQCFGKEASAYNKKLVEGKRVRLEPDVEDRDKYHRLLRYVWLGDTMINEKLVFDGYAQVMTIPPNVKYADRFRTAQTQAREAKRGLWERCKK